MCWELITKSEMRFCWMTFDLTTKMIAALHRRVDLLLIVVATEASLLIVMVLIEGGCVARPEYGSVTEA